MPNHLHCVLHFPTADFDLNKIIGNAKRFMAYEMLNRLEEHKVTALLELLRASVTELEKKKGQLHNVFKQSFEAKPIFSDKFLLQKINYIHNNPVSGKWNLAKDFVSYEHSSVRFTKQERHSIFCRYISEIYEWRPDGSAALFIGVSRNSVIYLLSML